VQAIHAEADQYVIDPEKCVDCENYFEIARCKWICPVDACIPERVEYLRHDASLQNKGTPPLVLKPGGKATGEMRPA
jgi:ferredoxin